MARDDVYTVQFIRQHGPKGLQVAACLDRTKDPSKPVGHVLNTCVIDSSVLPRTTRLKIYDQAAPGVSKLRFDFRGDIWRSSAPVCTCNR
jgi:hypothetical protein